MRFQKGHKKYGGRKKGTPNKDITNYLDLQLWFKQGFTDLNLLDSPEKRIPWVVQIMDKLLGKVNNIPGTPEDSVKNAEQAAEILRELETPVLKDESASA